MLHFKHIRPVETFTLTIQDLARGGAGVARDANGRVIFVPFTAPGDEVRVEILEAKKNYAQGRLLEILKPSPLRQTPPCPAFGRCGGCQWQHLPYELQWKTKSQGSLHALARVGVTELPKVEELPAERIWEYRNRIQLRGFQEQLGFYAAGTHEVVSLDRCDIARPEINSVWSETREQGRAHKQAYKVEVEVLEDASIRKSWNSRHAASGFRQVHDEQNEKLKAWVSGALTENTSILDLFGGAGNLSLGLLSKVRSVACVDIGAPRDRQVLPQQSESYRFHREPVSRWLAKTAALKPAPRFDSAILDPPREGLAADFTVISQSLEVLGVKEIVAVGCDPDAWARDVSRFLKRGWKVDRLAVLDLFPQTPHVESIARLKFGL